MEGRTAEIESTALAFHQSEEKYRALFECAKDAIFILDFSGKILDLNRIAAKRLGYSHEGLTGGMIQDIDSTAISSQVPAWMAEIRERGQVVFESAHVRRDGTPVPVEISARIIDCEGGAGVLLIARDITWRRQAETAISESEEKYRKLFEDAIDGISLADAETGEIIGCNRAMLDLVERAAGEVIGKSQKILHPPEDPGLPVSVSFEEHRTTKPGEVIETKVITGTGKTKDVIIKANLIEIGGRKVMQGFFRDITSQLALNRRAQEQEKLAAVGGIASGIAHEVKNPLFAISSGIQLLMEELHLDGEQRETFEIIYRDVMRMDRLVRQLQVFSSVRKPRRTRHVAAALFREAITLNRGLFADRSIRIEESFEPGLPELFADRDQVHQVLINLLQNAISVSADGSSIEISARRARSGRAVVLGVRDHGPGIPEEIRGRIFDPFFTTRRGSAGMGLAISRKIASDHGGLLAVGDAPGGGSLFTLELPAEDLP